MKLDEPRWPERRIKNGDGDTWVTETAVSASYPDGVKIASTWDPNASECPVKHLSGSQLAIPPTRH